MVRVLTLIFLKQRALLSLSLTHSHSLSLSLSLSLSFSFERRLALCGLVRRSFGHGVWQVVGGWWNFGFVCGWWNMLEVNNLHKRRENHVGVDVGFLRPGIIFFFEFRGEGFLGYTCGLIRRCSIPGSEQFHPWAIIGTIQHVV